MRSFDMTTKEGKIEFKQYISSCPGPSAEVLQCPRAVVLPEALELRTTIIQTFAKGYVFCIEGEDYCRDPSPLFYTGTALEGRCSNNCTVRKKSVVAGEPNETPYSDRRRPGPQGPPSLDA
jgi:hypothetical protein